MPAAKSTPKPASAIETATADAKETGYGSVTFDGVDYGIVRRPPMLLISELGRTSTGDPEAMGVIAEFFDVTLGDNYRAFKRAVYRSENPDEAMNTAMQNILEQTLGRPTE